MLQFPYGIADFRRIRQQGHVYVDRTAHIHDLERLGSILVFLRPRRFGKSLWLQTLANYYDLRRRDEFEQLFGDLAIGREPTLRRNSYCVLQWNFSTVDPTGGAEQIAASLRRHICSQARVFARHYQAFLPEPIQVEGYPEEVLDSLLSVLSETPYTLYLLIDEYDNFVNEVMVQYVQAYRALFGKDGPFKQLFKAIKRATEGQGLERVFVTGVSPVALNDLTSGFNNAEDVTHTPDLASLCGFRDQEIQELLGRVAADRKIPLDTLDHAVRTMRFWYNGYRFCTGVDELVYNPTNVLYFLKHLHLRGEAPENLQDQNLRTDRGKLSFLARSAAGAGVIERLTESAEDTVSVQLVESFSVDDLTRRLAKDPEAIVSMLFYMGLLTRTALPFQLRIPNLVVRKLFLDRLLEMALPDLGDSSEASGLALSFYQDGDLAPLLGFFQEKLLPVLSNRDQGAAPRGHGKGGRGVNEMVIKGLFLSILFADHYYRTFSEPELDRGYADLCLLVRQEMRRYGFFDFLFEFKLVRRKLVGKKGRELAGMDEAEVRRLPEVREAFTEGREQVKRYRTALVKQEGALNLRSYVVVAVGLERMLGEEIIKDL